MSVTQMADGSIETEGHLYLVLHQKLATDRGPESGDGFVRLVDGELGISTGLPDGEITVHVEFLTGEPELDVEGWDAVTDVSMRAEASLLFAERSGWIILDLPDLAFQGVGDYRVRVCARGRSAAAETLDPVEHHTFFVWPGPLAPMTTHVSPVTSVQPFDLPVETPRGPFPAIYDDIIDTHDSQYLIQHASPGIPSMIDGDNGLVDVYTNMLTIHTGLDAGDIHLHLELHESEPPLDLDTWGEIVDVSFHAEGKLVFQELLGGWPKMVPDLNFQGPGDYRIRVCARGRDEAEATFEPVEFHAVYVWPAELRPILSHQHRDKCGERWRESRRRS